MTTRFDAKAISTSFERDGWVVLRSVLKPSELAVVVDGVADLARWAEGEGPGLHHFELTDAGPTLARSEDFVPHHAGLAGFITDGVVLDILEVLFREPALLFKEKINYKHPGGGGFAPHQDATAYRFVDHHISCMVPLDQATLASGCLFMAPGHTNGTLANSNGCIEPSIAETLDWRPVEVEPGDLVFFDSYAPHYSDTNTTERPRRAAYLTYNAASKGEHRSTYYQDKAQEFAGGLAGSADRVRLSINDDFLGRPVESR